MPNKSSDKVVKARSLKVFLALYDYATATTDNLPSNFNKGDFSEDDFDWNGLTVSFNIKKAKLKRICGAKSNQADSKYRQEISDHVSYYLPVVLGSLFVDQRSKKDIGAGVWKFDIIFRSLKRDENIKWFNEEWEKKRTSGDFEVNPNSDRSTSTAKSITEKNLVINWRTACQNQLDRQKKQITSSPLHRKTKDLDSVHVPLGLMERKESERPKFDQTQEISPEQDSETYQQRHTETKRVEHEDFLTVISQRRPGEHVVILGEPGAGKTTLLIKVWEWLLGHEQPGEDIIVAWVPLAAVTNNELRDYLRKNWLFLFGSDDDQINNYWKSFLALAKAGRVWLLLDGADEMGAEALGKLDTTLQEDWARSTRAIITCRLNLWDTSSHRLQTSSNFQVYRTLDFKYVNPAGQDEVKVFIDNWFRSTNETDVGQKLRAALDEVGKERIKDLAKNPLRLTLLCDVWDDEKKLPDTQAGLYEMFVDYMYDWKATDFPEAVKLRGELDQALGDLAKQGINKQSLRFRFTKAELRKWVPVVEQRQALMDLGWLCGGEENKPQMFTFFHPTFQEYFAACSIDNWDYFLPRAHVDEPTYRVFESEWLQPIVLWFGRGDVADEDKEKL
jgi:energy-coupling factor transporter ATP-binding protein EcfA2